MIVNGKFVAGLERSALPDSWLLGDGIFESLRTYSNRPFALDLHLERLAAGLVEIYAPQPDLDSIRSSIAELLLNLPQRSGRLRIIYGADGNWLLTHDAYEPEGRPARCTVVETTSRSPIAKRTSYGDRFALRRLAQEKGFDDAILSDLSGTISESSTSNLIAQIDGKWQTPDLNSGCLAGVTRRILIENFDVTENQIKVSDLARARSVALISSLREIQPVMEIDGRFFAGSDELIALKSAFSAWILGNLEP
jgi:branched-chain amino acid aminotransferase